MIYDNKKVGKLQPLQEVLNDFCLEIHIILISNESK